MTTLEVLKKLPDSNLLKREDWILLTKIAKNEQMVFRPCSCSHKNKLGSVLFTKDSKTTYTNPNHSAYGLGPVYNRFKCSATGCNTSFSPVTMLVRYNEFKNTINTTRSKRTLSLSPNEKTPEKLSKPFLWSDAIDLPTSTDFHVLSENTPSKSNSYHTDSSNTSMPFSKTTLNHCDSSIPNATAISQSNNIPSSCLTEMTHSTDNLSSNDNLVTQNYAQSQTINSLDTHTHSDTDTQLSSKLDNLTTILLLMKSESDSKLNFLLNSVEKLMTKNQDLERKVTDLSERLQITEDKLKTSNPLIMPISTTSNTSITHHYDNTIPPNQPTSDNMRNHSQTSWASIANAPLEHQNNLAKIKAKENIQINRRSALVAQLSNVAKTRTAHISATRSVYVAGFEYIKLREIWKALFNARFQVSRIITIQWIGKTVLDIIVSADYHLQFISELALNNKFRILTFNPSCNLKALTSEQNETAMRAFAVRCIKNITNTANSTACINHFKNISQQYCDKNQDLSKIFSEE
jgi:hypothetical protein